MALACQIERFWWNKGHEEVLAWVEVIPAKDSAHNELFAVRSNLVNGMPPRLAWKLSKS